MILNFGIWLLLRENLDPAIYDSLFNKEVATISSAIPPEDRQRIASLQWTNFIAACLRNSGVRDQGDLEEKLHDIVVKLLVSPGGLFRNYDPNRHGQLRDHYAGQTLTAQRIGTQYSPTAFADWFHDKIVEWSDSAPNGHATQHAFRKTGLQLAYRGGLADTMIATDASITESVMHGHYVDEMDEELLLKSNRTFDRIVSSLPAEVAERYGYSPGQEGTGLDALVKAAIDRQDWDGATELITRIKKNGHP